jgi:hypothetical protein
MGQLYMQKFENLGAVSKNRVRSGMGCRAPDVRDDGQLGRRTEGRAPPQDVRD